MSKPETQAEDSFAQDDLRTLVHDLRSPLSAMSTWIELLSDSTLGDQQRRNGLGALSQSVHEMAALLENFAEKQRSRDQRP